MKVVFSSRAYTSLLVEVKEKITTETGGVFLGFFRDDVWYVIESIDPGPNSIFRPAYFEYDNAYVNHLINKVSRIYKTQLELIGLWHRHPGSFDSFSGTDDGTNSEYAKLSSIGAISGLVNIDPEFRLTMYHVGFPLSYQKIEYEVGDKIIPAEIMELHDYRSFQNNLGEYQRRTIHKTKVTFSEFLKIKKQEAISDEFGEVIHTYLKKRTMADVKALNPYNYGDDLPVEDILSELEADLNYLEKIGIGYKMLIEAKLLVICGEDNNPGTPWKLVFGKDSETIVFRYNELVFKYHKGLLKSIADECSGRRSKCC